MRRIINLLIHWDHWGMWLFWILFSILVLEKTDLPLDVQVLGGVCLDGINIFSICIHELQIGSGAESNSQLISMEIEYIMFFLRCWCDESGMASKWTLRLPCVFVPCAQVCAEVQDVHIPLPLVFDDNEGGNDDNDTDHKQHSNAAITIFTSLIVSMT